MDTIVAHNHLRTLLDCLRWLLPPSSACQDGSARFRQSSHSAQLKPCSCALAAENPPQARPISPPFKVPGESQHDGCYVEFQSRIHLVHYYWTKTVQYPNLSDFPVVNGMVVDAMALSGPYDKDIDCVCASQLWEGWMRPVFAP